MTKTTLYGNTNCEKDAKKASECYEIVSVIMKFGVSQDQIVRIMYLLALELESRKAMLDLSATIKKYFVSLVDDNNEHTGLIV